MKRMDFVIMSLLLSTAIFSQKILDPQIIAQQELQKKRAEESGYADIEIDLLHKEIGEKLSKLMVSPFLEDRSQYVKEDQGKYTFIFPIAFGESIKAIDERYLYSGDIHIGTDKEGKSVTSIKMVFRRLNPLSYSFKEEEREVENPTPNFDKEFKNLDRNDDIRISYADSDTDENKGRTGTQDLVFKKKYEVVLKDIPYFEKKVLVVETYKQYLRRAKKKLSSKVDDIELKEKVGITRLLQFN